MAESLSTNSLFLQLNAWNELKVTTNSIADKEVEFPVDFHGLKGSLENFLTAGILERIRLNFTHFIQYRHSANQVASKEKPSGDILILVPTQKEADEIQSDLETIFDQDKVEIYQLPWWGMIPYRKAPVGGAIFGQRAGVLSKMAISNQSYEISSFKPRIFIVTQRSFVTPVPPPEYIKKQSFILKKGMTVDTSEIVNTLVSKGYLRVPRVGMKGEFALHGEVLDIFMSGETFPYRINFDFDEISSIKTFDLETQTSLKKIDQIVIYPSKEFLWTEESARKLDEFLESINKDGISNDYLEYDKSRKSSKINERSEVESYQNQEIQSSNERSVTENNPHLALTDKAKEAKELLITELGINFQSEGEELFYGCLFDRKYSVLDYLSKGSLILCYDYDRLLNGQNLIQNEYMASYRVARQSFPVLPPQEMIFDTETILEKAQNVVRYKSLDSDGNLDQNQQDENSWANGNSFEQSVTKIQSVTKNTAKTVLKIECENSHSFFGNLQFLKETLTEKQEQGWKIFVFADNPNQALRIKEILKPFIEPEDKTLYPLTVESLALTEGFTISDKKILVLQENEIFGRRKQMPKSMRKTKSKAIETFVELNPGDFVVHVQYGIGLFQGIERVKTSGTERDYIKLLYADDEVVFTPIEQVNLVQRYVGNEDNHPKLDRIGSKSWSARKAKVQQAVEELAEKLIDLYSKRQASRGFAFPKETEWQAAFEAAFPYEDTEDQFNVTAEVKADMEKPVPMDRLVCGDVGYGKTEIAMRSAFKAVMGGKQVAFLAPTTILAQQHYENCLERFKNFPVTIAELSRFVPPAEQKKTLQKLAMGQVDIIVGTHRILQKDVIFKDLGLLIIDEEQRFGVKDKEKLKTLKTNIDCLAMSATPIPRTLHMSLLKIRDMSLLTTAPQNRQPVETVVCEYNDEKVAAAIRKEVERGGQIFYLHNRVESLLETQLKLQKLVPEMIVETAHGKMTSDQLDDIFRRFKMGGAHILVSTTIIENGIDIPNVNTIIIDRADMYGVSQLYQLRGRVGRSDRKAYAYLFYPENKSLSEVAMKRLQVISDFTELGSGFKIAMKDMEIRGAGNLLGKDQSGDVCAVGFDMYLHLLNRAIEKLTIENWQAPEEVLLELEYTGFIPNDYITTAENKMEVYKKIASISTTEELGFVQNDLIDRFGPLPPEVNSLLSLAKIRIICRKLSITSLREHGGIAKIEFGQVQKMNVDKLLRLIKSSSGRIKLDSAHPNMLFMQTGKIGLEEKADYIRENLEELL